MNKNDIGKFALRITNNEQVTIVKLKNGKEYVGYFDSNTTPVGLKQNNKWNFMVLHFEKEGRKLIDINGDDIINIEIKNLI